MNLPKKQLIRTAVPVALLLGLTGFAFLKQKKFGKKAGGKRLERMKRSPHYSNGQFHNLSPTPSFTEGGNFFTVMKKFFFEKNKNAVPANPIRSEKTDLHNLDPEEELLVWFGHSSYFIQSAGKKILVDPVFSGSASPVSFTNKAFAGTNRYAVEDVPPIDYLFITHDHWDHCDFETLTKLEPKINKVITGLGTGAHLEGWGFDPEIITEMDWNETIIPEEGLSVHAVPARHFSGRGFKRNSVLWTSFILQTPAKKIFIGGDSGYDSHFAKAGKEYGPFDLAILENGQYDRHWKYIHMMPHETFQAAVDLRAKQLLPVHNSKFALSNHSWNDPLTKISEVSDNERVKLITPIIGQKVDLNDPHQSFSHWWEEIAAKHH